MSQVSTLTFKTTSVVARCCWHQCWNLGRALALLILATALRSSSAVATPRHMAPTGVVAYSQAVDVDEPAGQGRAEAVPFSLRRSQRIGYDLFLCRIPGGKPVQLTDHRRSHDLGAVISNIAFDKTGMFVAFLASRKRYESTISPHLLWLLNLHTRMYSLVRLPGAVTEYSWAPIGLLMAVDVRIRNENKTLLLNAKTRQWKTLFGDRQHTRLWNWMGNNSLVYEDEARHSLLKRSICTGRVLAQWFEPASLTSLALFPAPDGQHVLIQTKGAFYLATPGHPFKRAFSTTTLSELVWSPDSRHVFLHTFSSFPSDAEANELPTGTDHSIALWDRPQRRWQRTLLSWTDSVISPWRYEILACSHNNHWLLVAHNPSQSNSYTPEVWAYYLGAHESTKLFQTQAPIISMDWHEVTIKQ